MEENIEHAKLRALSQILLDKSKGVEAFEEYMREAFPYLETQKRRDKDEMVRILKSEVAKGAIGFTPLTDTRAKSRLRAPVKVQAAKGRSPAELAKLYKKLGESRDYSG